jgi:hypothetical protein
MIVLSVGGCRNELTNHYAGAQPLLTRRSGQTIVFSTSTRIALMMDVTTFAAGPESYDRLSQAQISIFFSSNTTATREECDKLAAELLEGPVSATAIQGGTSYTVQRHQARQVVQFRSSELDMIRLRLIQQVYDKFVPRCLYHGLLGSLHVYIWDLVSGPAFCRVRREMFTIDAEQRLSQTVQDFARLVYRCWIMPVVFHYACFIA